MWNVLWVALAAFVVEVIVLQWLRSNVPSLKGAKVYLGAVAVSLFIVLYVTLFLAAPKVPEMSAEEMATLFRAQVPTAVIEHIADVNSAMHHSFQRRLAAFNYSMFVFLLPLVAFLSSYLPGLCRNSLKTETSREVSA